MGHERERLVTGPQSDLATPRNDNRAYRPWSRILIMTLFTTICLIIYRAAISSLHPFPRHRHHHHCTNKEPPTLTYPGESITWTPCGTLASRPLECANITVPLDHFNTTPTSPPLHTHNFTIPLLRLRSNKTTAPNDPPIPNLLLNPGGPGGSGTSLLHSRGAQLATIIGDGFHLIGFDPRGVNNSSPQVSCYPSPAARQAHSAVRSKRIVEDSGELWAWTGNYVQACEETMGEWGRWVNTPQTAADMNSILDAVGQQGLYYWGFSYGTLLGQTYAALFPDRVERVIIDGVANQWDWYEGLIDAEMLADTDRVFEGFVEECVKAGEGRCELAKLAGTKEELMEVVLKGLGRLRDDPVGVYVNNTVYGVLDFWAVWYEGVFSALYKPAKWGELADNLASLLNGNATAAFLAYGQKDDSDYEDALNFVSLNDGASGPASWPADRTGLLDKVLPFFNQSMFSEGTYQFYFTKRAWSTPRTHGYVPKRSVKTAHPLLLLSTTYDPVCPLVSARSANEAFEGSRIVEVKGYGHCSLAVPSMCIAQHVRDYLYKGKLPDENVQCEADGKPYFAKPEEGAAFVEAQAFGEEERQIRLAQQELARESWLKPW